LASIVHLKDGAVNPMSRIAVTGDATLFEIFDSIAAIVWTGDGDGVSFRFTWLSRASETILGYSAEEWVASPDFWRDHIHPDDRHVVAIRQSETQKNRDHELVYRMIAANGRVVWIRDTARVDRANRITGVMLDITTEHQAYEALARSEEKYHRLVDASPDAIGVHTKGSFVYVNPKFVELFGASHETDLIGRDVLSLVAPEYRDVVRNRQVQIAIGNNVPLTREQLVRIDGVPFDADVMAIPVEFNGTKAVQVVVRRVTIAPLLRKLSDALAAIRELAPQREVAEAIARCEQIVREMRD
jgi:PAS domain S-box-containing protein